jgi:hypothetical protein
MRNCSERPAASADTGADVRFGIIMLVSNHCVRAVGLGSIPTIRLYAAYRRGGEPRDDERAVRDGELIADLASERAKRFRRATRRA